MDFKGLRVLLLDGSGKQTLAMARGLKEAGCHVTVFCASRLDTCYASRIPDEKILVPRMRPNDTTYIEKLLEIVSSGRFDVLMPVGDLSTNPITLHEDAFSQYVKIACAPRETYIKAFDKQRTFDTAIEKGIPCPYTRHSTQSIEDYLSRCTFPIIIKPRQGLGSIGFHKFESEAEFRKTLNEDAFNVDDYVVQEFVHFNKRVGTNLFVDQHGNICTAYAVDVHRWFPLDAGAGVLIETVDAHEALSQAGKLLQALEWKGFANVAFMVDAISNQPKLLEINGRIPASIKMAYMCGCNVSRQFLQMVYDQEVDQYPENEHFGMYLRHLDTDLAWFIKSPDRFRANPSWFSWKNTTEILYSKDDRKPFFAHMLQKLLKYRAIMDTKKH